MSLAWASAGKDACARRWMAGVQNSKQRRHAEADFLASRQIHHDEISECRLQRTQRPDRKRRGSTRGNLTGGRCAADETMVITRALTGGRHDDSKLATIAEETRTPTRQLDEASSQDGFLRPWFRRC